MLGVVVGDDDCDWVGVICVVCCVCCVWVVCGGGEFGIGVGLVWWDCV